MCFIGLAAVLMLFTLVFVRSVRIARRAPTPFGYLLAMGIGTLLFGGAVINMAMATGLLPTAGLPLPSSTTHGSAFVPKFSPLRHGSHVLGNLRVGPVRVALFA